MGYRRMERCVVRLRRVIRRLVALTVGAAMLHLNASFLRADLACAEHSNTGHMQASAAMHQQHDGTHDVSHSLAGATNEQCEAPAQADCCHAMASCSPSVGELRSSGDVAVAGVGDCAPLLAQSLPTSRDTAPEPPPPRA